MTVQNAIKLIDKQIEIYENLVNSNVGQAQNTCRPKKQSDSELIEKFTHKIQEMNTKTRQKDKDTLEFFKLLRKQLDE